MTQAGLIYLENGDIENAIWSFEEGYVIVTCMSGDLILKIPDTEFTKHVLPDFCSSDPKPKK